MSDMSDMRFMLTSTLGDMSDMSDMRFMLTSTLGDMSDMRFMHTSKHSVT